MNQLSPSSESLLNTMREGNTERHSWDFDFESNTPSLSLADRVAINKTRQSSRSSHSSIPAKTCLIWQKYTDYILRLWNYKWTAEACSYTFSVLTFAGIVTMLLCHQNKPLPKWPHLLTVNSIVSLFSMLMRTSIGLVLAEGTSQSSNHMTEALSK